MAGSGAAGGKSGKSGQSDRERGSEATTFDTEKDWVDDEGMAPPVLD